MTDFAEFGLNVTEVTLIIFLLETLHNLEKMQRHWVRFLLIDKQKDCVNFFKPLKDTKCKGITIKYGLNIPGKFVSQHHAVMAILCKEMFNRGPT